MLTIPYYSLIFEETYKKKFKALFFLHILIVIKLLNIKMLERPKFIFEQQEERQEESVHEGPKLMRNITEAKFDYELQVKRGNLETSKGGPGNGQDKRQQSYSKKNNPQIGFGSYRSQSHIIDPSAKQSEKQGLKYSQAESHMLVLTSTTADRSAGDAIKTSSHQYEDKITNHLEEAKGMKPNTFFREDNQSPIPQNDQRFTLAPPPAYAPTQFDPYKYVGLNKKRSNNKSYQIMLESDAKKKKKAPKNLADTTNESSFHNSSQVALNQSEPKPSESVQPSAQIIREQKEEVGLLYPPLGTILLYSFQIQKVFGVNFLNPDFKIFSPDRDLLVSAKKQSFHINSHYNIFSGEIKNNKKIGVIIGNFGGTQFNIFDTHSDSEELVATICYRTEMSCNAYRKIQIYVKSPETNKCFTDQTTKGKSLRDLYEQGMKEDILKVATKEPTWRDDLQIYVMNFKGKAKMSSTKNMVLIRENQNESSLLFCKQGYKKYYLQISRPFNLLISMGILLSSFDFKLFCQ